MQSSENDPAPTEPLPAPDDTDGASRASKRQRQSQSPSEDPALEPGDVPGSARSRKTLKQPPTFRGSSRDTNEMHRSSPEASGSIKYTRTGRVSKATKGQRVHHCEECGKTYTRAEHLRRHQQNHKPGAFPCDFPNCSRSFYREDLLIRHKARHNDPHNPPSRRHSVGSQSSAPDAGGLAPGPTSTPGISLPPTSQPVHHLAPELQRATSESDAQQSSANSRAPKRVPVPPNELNVGGVPLLVEGGSSGTFRNPWIPPSRHPSSPLSSPATYNEYGYESPDEFSGDPYYQALPARARYFSDASYTIYDQPVSALPSPVSAGSSTLLIPQWPFQFGRDAPYSIAPFPRGDLASNDQQVISTTFPYGASGLYNAATRDHFEIEQLTLPGLCASTMDDSLDEAQLASQSHYVDAYWSCIHEFYPILHKPTYDHVNANPLLRAAILALGAQAVGGRADLSNARTLHEKSLKVLKKRNLMAQNTFRVCDMQAVVLIEIYAIFKSRRPPLQFSKNFEEVFQGLVDSSPSAPMPSGSPQQLNNFDNLPIEDRSQLQILCKQRLLLACYALEQQQNLLFGRTSAIGFGIASRLPFPHPQALWDNVPDSDTSAEATPNYNRVSEALSAVPYMMDDSPEPHDTFQSVVMMACICDTSNDILEWADCREDYSLLRAAERSSTARLAFHAFGLCKSTPIRQLLAVAGESWVMAEKLATVAEYTSAQNTVRSWAATASLAGSAGSAGTPNEDIRAAARHALGILECHREAPRTGLLFQEWAVHLAAVVVWAYAYMVRGDGHRPRTSAVSRTEPSPSTNELEQAITALVSAGPSSISGWTQARNVLIWAKTKIAGDVAPHTCGVVSGSLDVLAKLVDRGDEEGWF